MLTAEKIAKDLIELTLGLEKEKENASYKHLVSSVLNPINIANFFKEHNEIKKFILTSKIPKETLAGYRDDMNIYNFNFANHLDNDVAEEIIEHINQRISSMGKEREYLKLIYVNFFNGRNKLPKEKYLEYIKEGLKNFKDNLDILDFTIFNKDTYFRNRLYFDQHSKEMNLICLPTHNLTIDSHFKKEFEIIVNFYTSLLTQLNEEIINKPKVKKILENKPDEEKEEYLYLYNKKLRNLTNNLFGFNKLEEKIIKSKRLSIEEKEKYLEKLMSLFDKKFTNKLKQTGSYILFDKNLTKNSYLSEGLSVKKNENNIKFILSFDENSINVFVNDFIFNAKKNKSMNEKTLGKDDYNLSIKRINKTSALITLNDLSEDLKYCENNKEITDMFQLKFLELIHLFENADKKRKKSLYYSYTSSKDREAMFGEVDTFINVLHGELRSMKLFSKIEKMEKLEKIKTKRKI